MFRRVLKARLSNKLQAVAAQYTTLHRHHGFQSAVSILRGLPGDLVISKQKLPRADAIACVRLKRQESNQNLGFASRPFVLCGLLVKRPQLDNSCTNDETAISCFR
jgi:hypothetical protein